MTAHGTVRHDDAADDKRSLAAAPAAVRPRCRLTALHVEHQSTRDAVALDVAAVVCWHVHDVQQATVAFQRGRFDVASVALAALRTTVVTSMLASLLCERCTVDRSMRLTIRRKTARAGITVHSAEIREVNVPADVQARCDAALLAELWRCRSSRAGIAVAA
ncbi:hypothetical protein HLB44_01700 [Aquincola sp. S2]|uniref:Band 7 domain-containing protein n=1 Tax=Pseudaquabacterium terrae TaxID=2732868 RepID=A0ABX2E9J8_9BURK|nr:SPFH domain-containing protein [Aquabacterium terrae]NRF65690.1 hypothetical protein [Aquabacterium terrae]